MAITYKNPGSYNGYRFVKFSKHCPCCDETDDRAFPLWNLGDVLGCEGCVENDEDERDWWRANADDCLQR